MPGGRDHWWHGNRPWVGLQGRGPVELEIPVPGGGPLLLEPHDLRATTPRMAGPPTGAAKVQIPRWIQPVGLPILLLFLWVVAGAARHVVFLFLVAALIAFLLNPIVRGLTRVWIPRGFGVAMA